MLIDPVSIQINQLGVITLSASNTLNQEITMPTNIHHGITVTELAEGTRPINTIDVSTIGVVATADDADATAFPLNRPALVNDVIRAKSLAGTTGTLLKVLDAIGDHGSPNVIVVRVAEGATEAEQNTNIIGGSVDGLYTGMQALRAARTNLGITPRILAVPGMDTQAVTAELITIAKDLGGFVYASAYGANTITEAADYRNNFGDREVMIIYPDFVGFNTVTSSNDTLLATARAIGLRAKIDEEQGWWKSLSNEEVQGVTGITKDLSWELQSPTTDVGYLNQREVTGIIRSKGYRFWGCRTASSDPLFAFEVYTRTAQVLKDTIAEAHMWALAKPLSTTLTRDILEGINAKFREMVALGQIIGAGAWIDDALNTKETLQNGQLTISYDYTPVPPIENLLFRQTITNTYLIDFAEQVSAA